MKKKNGPDKFTHIGRGMVRHGLGGFLREEGSINLVPSKQKETISRTKDTLRVGKKRAPRSQGAVLGKKPGRVKLKK